MPITRSDCETRDLNDALAPLRAQFFLPEGVIYLDGNSLGAQPRAALARAQQVITQEWGVGLIRSWNTAGWFELPQRLGDQLAPLVGAQAGEVVVTDTTSINLFKVLAAALRQQQARAPARRVIVSERRNFPTDLYIAQGLIEQLRAHGAPAYELRLIDSPEELPAALGDDVAVLMLTHVNYQTGYLHDMATVTALAHHVGALTVWDLAHSAGAVPVALNASQADYAVGCTYKYLNGGPGVTGFSVGACQTPGCFLAAAVGLVGPCAPVCHGARLPARAWHFALPVRHPAHHLAGDGGMRPGYFCPDQHGGPARKIAGSDDTFHRSGAAGLR